MIVMDILYGLTKAIKAEYPGVKAWIDVPLNGFTPPCFVVRCISRIDRPATFDQTRMQLPFEVLYFPSDAKANPNPQEEVQGVADTVMALVKRLDLLDGSSVRGRNVNAQMMDGVLHVLVDYNVWMYSENTTDKMASVEIKGGPKSG